MGGTLTTVYIRIGAFLPINPSPTILCVCHSGFLIVSEYFPDDWCINRPYKESIYKEMNNDYDLNLHSMTKLPGWLCYWQDSDSTILFNIVGNHEQCLQKNIVQS